MFWKVLLTGILSVIGVVLLDYFLSVYAESPLDDCSDYLSTEYDGWMRYIQTEQKYPWN